MDIWISRMKQMIVKQMKKQEAMKLQVESKKKARKE